jgi:hypothetical protein
MVTDYALQTIKPLPEEILGLVKSPAIFPGILEDLPVACLKKFLSRVVPEQPFA